MMAKLLVFSGNPLQLSAGDTLELSQVYLAGIGFPSSKAELISLKLLAVCDFEILAIKIKISKKKGVLRAF
jgi:hypothetical protein